MEAGRGGRGGAARVWNTLRLNAGRRLQQTAAARLFALCLALLSMKFALFAVLSAMVSAGCASQHSHTVRPASQDGLELALQSSQADYIQWRDSGSKSPAATGYGYGFGGGCKSDNADECAGLESITVTGSRVTDADLITNNQEAGVDEGGIVKKMGPLLLVLRQGVLHVIDTGAPGRERFALLHSHPVVADDSRDDLYYDEILTFSGGAILLGYSFVSNAAELFVFRLDAGGGLEPRGRWQLKVDDYFSSNDSGARIRGGELVLSLSFPAESLLKDNWPLAARVDTDGKRIEATRVDLLAPDDLRVLDGLGAEPQVYAFLRCDLDGLLQQRLACTRSAAVANAGASTYIAADGIYLADYSWTAQAWRRPDFDPWMARWTGPNTGDYASRVLRLPQNRAEAPAVVATTGLPNGRFGFKETADGLYLIGSERISEDAQRNLLQHIPFSRFRARSPSQTPAEIRASIEGEIAFLRFDQDAAWLALEEAGGEDREDGEYQPGTRRLHRLPLDGGPTQHLPLPAPVERIELLAEHVLLMGSVYRAGDPQDMRTVLVRRDSARVGPLGHWPGMAADLSSRSHSFNAARLDDGTELAGLPVFAPEPAEGSGVFREDLAEDLLVFRRAGDALQLAARVDMQHTPSNCELDCYAWYGSARFFAFGDRLFTLSGELLKELRFDRGELRETGALRLREN